MKPYVRSASGLLAASLLPFFCGTAVGHSWPEQTFRLAPNGTMVGAPGFERSHVVRGERPEDSIVWLIPPNGREKVIQPDDKIARPDQRALNEGSYSEKFPMLKVAAGDFVAIKYLENGHVSRPELSNPTKPVNRGTVYLYGTTENDLSNYNMVDIHLKWTADGNGGDKKGRLLATRNYDDGQCHEAIPVTGDPEGITTHRQAMIGANADEPVNGGLSCQSDVQIPFDIPTGQVFTVIWVWDWPTMNVAGVPVPPASYDANSPDSGKPYVTVPELYTGVVDFQLVDPCDDVLGDVKGPSCGAKNGQNKNVVKFAKQRRPTVAGIRAQMLKPFLVDVPQAGAGATAATANPTDIPVFGLIGVEAPQFPLPPAFFQPDNQDESPAAPQPSEPPAPSAPAPSPTTPPGFVGRPDKILTVTVTVPATTVTVTQSDTAPTGTATQSLPSSTGNAAPSSPSPSGTGSLATPTASTDAPKVARFLAFPKAIRARRAPGQWNY